MADAAILERQERAAVSDKLNAKATREIEVLLEKSEHAAVGREVGNGGWYYRMPAAGVRYYSF